MPDDSPKKSGREMMVATFDTIFIMVLCFLTLLSAMLVRGKVLVGTGGAGGLQYSFSLVTFLTVAAVLAAYLILVLYRSGTELKTTVRQVYDKAPLQEDPVETDQKPA